MQVLSAYFTKINLRKAKFSHPSWLLEVLGHSSPNPNTWIPGTSGFAHFQRWDSQKAQRASRRKEGLKRRTCLTQIPREMTTCTRANHRIRLWFELDNQIDVLDRENVGSCDLLNHGIADGIVELANRNEITELTNIWSVGPYVVTKLRTCHLLQNVELFDVSGDEPFCELC